MCGESTANVISDAANGTRQSRRSVFDDAVFSVLRLTAIWAARVDGGFIFLWAVKVRLFCQQRWTRGLPMEQQDSLRVGQVTCVANFVMFVFVDIQLLASADGIRE